MTLSLADDEEGVVGRARGRGGCLMTPAATLQVVNITGIDFSPKITVENQTQADIQVWDARTPTHVHMLSQQPIVQQYVDVPLVGQSLESRDNG